MNDRTPTVIVSRRVRSGAQREFERWTQRLLAAARRSKGYIGSEVQAPSGAHPREWVIIYRFSSAADLDAWLGSNERAALMAEGERLLEGPAREQRLVEPLSWAEAVTAVMSQRVRPGAEEDFRLAHERIKEVMERFDGFVRSDLVEPVPGAQDEHVIVFSFASKADLDRWLGSGERAELLRDVAPLIEGDRTLSVVGGFAGWFPPSRGGQPVRWKQAVAVLIALFPTTLTLAVVQRWLVPQTPWVLALLASNVLGVAILTWLLMPLVTRWLSGWLRK